VRGDAEQVDPAGGDFHDDEDVQASQPDRVGVEEVDRQQAVGLVAEEGSPAGVAGSGRGSDPVAGQDPPDSGERDLVAQPCEFTLDNATLWPSRASSPWMRR
jgi:hypothetical protein